MTKRNHVYIVAENEYENNFRNPVAFNSYEEAEAYQRSCWKGDTCIYKVAFTTNVRTKPYTGYQASRGLYSRPRPWWNNATEAEADGNGINIGWRMTSISGERSWIPGKDPEPPSCLVVESSYGALVVEGPDANEVIETWERLYDAWSRLPNPYPHDPNSPYIGTATRIEAVIETPTAMPSPAEDTSKGSQP